MPDPTVLARVVSGEFRYDREQYTSGDELEVHEGAIEKHPNTLERVEVEDENLSAERSAAGDEESEEETPGSYDHLVSGSSDVETEYVVDPDPSELTNPELDDRVQDVDDVDLLEAIRAAEVAGEDRTGAKSSIDARIDELEV